MSWQVIHGDCLDVLKEMPDASVDAVVTDPPYDLLQTSRRGSGRSNEPDNPYGRHGSHGGGFMGMKWDATGIAFHPETWVEVLRVMKPGAHLLACGGTRTYHRMVCAIEDAGFEIRDCLAWLYGSGFPKSLNLDGDLQGWGTALKPAHEPIVLARKPLVGTVAANVGEWGTGALNVDGCRISVSDDSYTRNCSADRGHADNRKREMAFAMTAGSANTIGRWPANVLLDEEAAAVLDEQSGTLTSGLRAAHHADHGKTVGIFGAYRGASRNQDYGGDSGGASRFFYCAKASRSERGEGNTHPTVKPLALMEWLCTLITPHGGTVLDHFTGSGTTGVAAVKLGFNFIGIEKEAEYVEIARKRIGEAQLPLFAGGAA